MKIGIISDIHGGLHELNAALNHLKAAKVDRIVCAGDLVDAGDFGDEVTEQIIRDAIPCVQGNHDRMARKRQALRQRKRDADGKTQVLKLTTIGLLEDLPQSLRFQWEDNRILLVHANPWGDDMYIYPESNIPLFRRVAKSAEADLVILGHTHRSMWVEIDGVTIINAGSTSQNYDLAFGTYGILSLPKRDVALFDVTSGKQQKLEKKSL